MLTIDGSFGEGGGQILRTSLALSVVTGTPFRIERVRAGRKNPGLLRQHLTAVKAAAEISHSRLSGATLGSSALTFVPGPITPGEYAFAVGSAGSAALVLQSVLPPLVLASGPSRLTLEGGTHNPFAPPFEFLDRAFLPLLNRMGPRVVAKLDRAGFYPAGGGRMTVWVEPCRSLDRLDLPERGEVLSLRAKAVVARLPRSIAERELAVVADRMSLSRASCDITELSDAAGPGNVVTSEVESQHLTEVFTGFGRRGMRAEQVANKAAGAALNYLAADVAAGTHLADQLLLPMALAGGGLFTTLALSAHSMTNIEVIKQFLPVAVDVTQLTEHSWRVEIT